MIKEKYEKAYLMQEKRIRSEIDNKLIIQKEKFDLFKYLLPIGFDGKVIVDVGGGAGALAVQILNSDCEYITLDISKRALNLAKLLFKKSRVYDKNNLILCDAHYLPLKSFCSNIVILSDVIEHVVQPKKVLVEARKILLSSGYLYVTVPYAFGIETIFIDDVLRLAYYLKIKKELPTHLTFYTIDSIKSLLEVNGFIIIKHSFYPASYLLLKLNTLLGPFGKLLEKTIFKYSCIALSAQLL